MAFSQNGKDYLLQDLIFLPKFKFLRHNLNLEMQESELKAPKT